jgi:hypothetical protein
MPPACVRQVLRRGCVAVLGERWMLPKGCSASDSLQLLGSDSLKVTELETLAPEVQKRSPVTASNTRI